MLAHGSHKILSSNKTKGVMLPEFVAKLPKKETPEISVSPAQ